MQTSFPIHPITEEQLVRYAAEEVDMVEASIVAAHINECTHCARRVARFQSIRALFAIDDSEPPSANARGRAFAIFRSPDYRVRRPVHKVPAPAQIFSARRFSFSVALALFVAMGLFFALDQVVRVSASAIPGDSLYPVKTTLENVQLELTFDTAAKAELQLDLANRRIGEIGTLAEEGKFSNIPEAAQAYENHVRQATNNLNAVGEQNAPATTAVAEHAASALTRYSAVLTNLTESTPPEIKSTLVRAVGATVVEQNAVKQKILSKPTVMPTAVTQPPATANRIPPTVVLPVLVPSSPTVSATIVPAATATGSIRPTSTAVAATGAATLVTPELQTNATSSPRSTNTSAAKTPIRETPTLLAPTATLAAASPTLFTPPSTTVPPSPSQASGTLALPSSTLNPVTPTLLPAAETPVFKTQTPTPQETAIVPTASPSPTDTPVSVTTTLASPTEAPPPPSAMPDPATSTPAPSTTPVSASATIGSTPAFPKEGTPTLGPTISPAPAPTLPNRSQASTPFVTPAAPLATPAPISPTPTD